MTNALRPFAPGSSQTMLSITGSFQLFLLAALVAAAYIAWFKGFRASLGVGMAITYLSATWFYQKIYDAPFSVPTSVAAILLLSYCLHSGAQVVSSWRNLDWVIGAIMAWHIAVDSFHDKFSLGLVARAYGEWVLPYAAGRFAVMHRQSIHSLSPWFVFVSLVISIASILESIFGINLWQACFHVVDDVVSRKAEVRFGFLSRAIGPTRHPIFLALVLMTLLPWSVVLIESAKGNRIRFFAGWLGLVCLLLAIVATGSRGPILALVAAGGFALALQSQVMRWVLTIAVVVLGIVTITDTERVLSVIETKLGQKEVVKHDDILELDNETVVFTGTRNRIYVAEIYGPLVFRGGPMGYGTVATSTFPPNIPGLPAISKTRERLGIVDNSYLLLGLRFGWVGAIMYLVLILAAIVTVLSLRHSAETIFFPNGIYFTSSIALVLFAISLEITTVFLSYEFGFWILFLIGVVAGIQAFTARTNQGKEIS